ncbi:sialate:O-sulfotransferase 2-like [Brachionichthys hirsutus]|uniref:sialate:O-sulfotransferase 2-like n=1 Tax=Brachionichthys hirsutus TaxID=412623 RepID=UPI00360486B4
MTVLRCQNNCIERGYMYAGLESGAKCFCGEKIFTLNTGDIECNKDCTGEKNQCGGVNRLTVYKMELRRHHSAIFKGCFHRPDNITLAFPLSADIQNMTVAKCVDMCTEKEKSLAVLAGDLCHCGFPTRLFFLHELQIEDMCLPHCPGGGFESCGNDEYFVVYQTQVQDNRCMDRRFLPTGAKQLVALASFPGSGNTWSRLLIEQASGFYTGSMHFDKAIYDQGFKGEGNSKSGKTICIKTHSFDRPHIERFGSSILLIRNPYKSLMAEFNRMRGGHNGFASQDDWRGMRWPVFVKNSAPKWNSQILSWLNYGENVKVVHYEDLKKNLRCQLREIVQFLGLKDSEERLLCVEGQKEGTFKRSNQGNLAYNPYTPQMQANINELIRRVDAALKEKEQPGVPEEYMPK